MSQKSKKKTTKKNFNEYGLIGEGKRNDYIFEKTRKYAYIKILKIDEKQFIESVKIYAESLNENLLIPLFNGEVKATTKSIIKYCINNKKKIKKYNNSDDKNRGIMSLENSKKTIRQKQKLGAEYTAKIKKEKTILKLKKAVLNMQEKGLKINISSLSKYSKISRPTILKNRASIDL